LDGSLELNRDSPTLYLLQGQAEAALAQMEPAEASGRIEPALASFRRAAQLDPENALPLLQAASVAFDVARPDLAQPLLELALAREGCVLHRLPIPVELASDPPSSLRIWQYVQYEQWSQLIARCDNASKAALRLGAEKEKLGELEAAERHFRQALSVGRAVGAARPNLYISVNAAINLMEDAYSNLLRVAEARESEEAPRWRNELGVLQVGRGMLAGTLQGYLQEVATNPPDSVGALLELEAEGLRMIIAGIGLTPASAPAPEVAAPVDPSS
jgi:tetratricopeptide (TPR) repeat protein